MANTSSTKPEFFRLPTQGGDPHFGFTRGWYYAAEKLGYFKLVRVRERGKLRGVTLIPYDQVAAFVSEQAKAQSTAAPATASVA
jgi:hypothetical protein